MDGTTRASPRVTIPFGSSTITAQTVEEATSLLLKVLQEYEKGRACGDSNRQAVLTPVKFQQSPRASLPSTGPLDDINADQKDTSEATPSSSPAAGPRRDCGKPAAAAGKVKRTASEAGSAQLEPSAKRPRTTQATQTYPDDFPAAAGQPMQQSSSKAVEVNGVICIDVEPHAASGPSAETAQQGQRNAQAVQVPDRKPHAAPKSVSKQAQQGRQKAQAVPVHGPKTHAASGPERKKARQPSQAVKAVQVDGPEPHAALESSGKQAQQGRQKAQAAHVPASKPCAASGSRGKQAQAQAKPRARSGPRRKKAQRARQEAQAVPANGLGHETPAQQARRFGNHFGDHPHRITMGGENPSKWREGRAKPRPYGHPGNKFWGTAKEAGIVIAELANNKEFDEDKMLEQISFVDIKLVSWASGVPEGDDIRTPGSKNNTEWFRKHAPAFYLRLEEHMARASDAIKCTCGECGAPAFFVWNGKHAWEHLLKMDRVKVPGVKVKYAKVKYGLQTIKPKGWPLPEQTHVYLMPSTSGMNASFKNGGQAWWNALGRAMRARFAAREWPFKPECY